MGYVSLHTHLETSPLDGASRIGDAVSAVAAMGQRALAITDHGNLGGTWKFYGEAAKTTAGSTATASPSADGQTATFDFTCPAGFAGQDAEVLIYGVRTPAFVLDPKASPAWVDIEVDAAQVRVRFTSRIKPGHTPQATLVFADTDQLVGVRPIMGMEAYLAIGDRSEKNEETLPAGQSAEGQKTKRYEHLTLLATSKAGWRSLVALHNKSHDSFWYKPRIDYALLEDHHEDLICLTGCLGGPVLGPLARSAALAAHARSVDPDLIDQLREDHLAQEKELRTAVADAAQVFAVDLEGRGVLESIDLLRSMSDAGGESLLIETSRSHHRALTALESCAAAAKRTHDDWEALASLDAQAQAMYQRAKANLERLVGIFGASNVFVEVMEHGITEESAALPLAHQLAKEVGVALVATNDSHYTNDCDHEAHDAWLALQANKGEDARVDNPHRFRFTGTGYHLRSEDEMRDLHPHPWWQEAVQRTGRVADLVADDVLPERYMRLPKFPPPPGYASAAAFFDDLTDAGAIARYGAEPTDEQRQRIDFERSVYHALGVADYALIVWEGITWGRSTMSAQDWIDRMDPGAPSLAWDRQADPTGSQWLDMLAAKDAGARAPILIGPGRGSAAGSAVSYALGIVAIDPIRHGLLFERFLDPTRVGMPDVDVDIERERTDDMRRFQEQRWGTDRVFRIGSFQKAKTRAAVKDAARLLGIPTAVQNKMTKSIPLVEGAYPPVPELLRESNPAGSQLRAILSSLEEGDAQRVSRFAVAFEDLTKGEGIHACGLLIGDTDMSKLIPARRDHKKNPEPLGITLWDGKDVDGFGMLKMDYLGLRTLDVIATSLRIASDLTGRGLTIDSIPDPDSDHPSVRRAFEMIARGETEGVFQLEGAGITDLAVACETDSIDVLCAVGALYRPGPMSANMHMLYADRKTGRRPVDYAIFTRDPGEQEDIRAVLGTTYGVIAYQEQAMQLGAQVAGFDTAHVNRLRKAVSKKIAAEFEALGPIFVDGASRDATMDGQAKRPFDRATAQKLWDGIKGSAQYAFNKSHSAAYGTVSYWTAWIKANHPAAFGAGLLSVTDKDETRHATMTSLRRQGITVLPPNVNASGVATTATDENTVLLGLAEIKGVGEEVATAIIAEREKGGAFTGSQGAARLLAMSATESGTTRKVVNTAVFTALAEAGALDAMGTRLGLTMAATALADRPDTPVPADEYGALGLWRRQHARLGMTLGEHPLDVYRAQITGHQHIAGETWIKPVALRKVGDYDGRLSTVRAMVSTVDVRVLNSGDRMTKLTLETPTAVREAVMWERTLSALEKSGHEIAPGLIAYFDVMPKTREIEMEVEDPDSESGTTTTLIQKTELEVRRIDVVDVVDEMHEPQVPGVEAILEACTGILTEQPAEPAPVRDTSAYAARRPVRRTRQATRSEEPTCVVVDFPDRARVSSAQTRAVREQAGSAVAELIKELVARPGQYPDAIYTLTNGATSVQVSLGSPAHVTHGRDQVVGSASASGTWIISVHVSDEDAQVRPLHA